MTVVTPDRVMVYVDGFNLYFGLKQSDMRSLLWLDVGKLAKELLFPGQQLVGVKYFSAMTSGKLKLDTPQEADRRDAKRARQATFLGALKGTGTVTVIEGRYQSMPKKCHHCDGHYYRHEEKKTDVSMATEMLQDAVLDAFDVAILISGDADLTPPVEAIKRLTPGKKVIVAFPPKRTCKDLAKACHGKTYLNKPLFSRCQLPPAVNNKGRTYRKPDEWTQAFIDSKVADWKSHQKKRRLTSTGCFALGSCGCALLWLLVKPAITITATSYFAYLAVQSYRGKKIKRRFFFP